jgi:hypothetical protein
VSAPKPWWCSGWWRCQNHGGRTVRGGQP